jgi:hypothetical protein
LPLGPPNAKQQLKLQEAQAREEFGETYELAEIGETATVDRLFAGFRVEGRLDALIDKCLKRLLFLRGLKSLSPVSASPPLQPVPATHAHSESEEGCSSRFGLTNRVSPRYRYSLSDVADAPKRVASEPSASYSMITRNGCSFE